MLVCRQCQAAYDVSPDDQAILQKLAVPQPTLCPVCSLQRRLTYRNERHLYRRNCDHCHKSILSTIKTGVLAPVYCLDCWNSDAWEASQYGREYDPTRPFFEQFRDLLNTVPQAAVYQLGSNENSEYGNFIWNVKNCYMSFSTVETDTSLYGKNVDYSRDCVDCYNVQKSELMYECTDSRESYLCAFMLRGNQCQNCYLCRDCQDCTDCFGCTNLKQKKYCWFNEQLTEQEFKKRLQDVLSSRASFSEQQKRFSEFSLSQPVPHAIIQNCEDVTGDYLYDAKNIRNSFDCYIAENLGDCYRIWGKDCYRLAYGKDDELCYECIIGPTRNRTITSVFCHHVMECAYSQSCSNSHDIFGCVGLKKKEYHILNKAYTPAAYQTLRTSIIEDMKRAGDWGEFFPAVYSLYPYNDSVAYEFWPLTKDQVLSRGWSWNDDQGGIAGKETLPADKVPHADEPQATDMAKEILRCTSCHRNYRLQPKEILLLKKFHLPLPLTCEQCRFRRRLDQHNIPPLHERACASCNKSIATTYGTDRKEIVYCKECYQTHFA